MTDASAIVLSAQLSEELKGFRLDQALAKCFPEHSRARLTQWLKDGQVKVNGKSLAPKSKVLGNETVEIEAMLAIARADEAEPIPLNIVHEDDDILIINKRPGLVVHPGAANFHGTLLNALLFHVPDLKHVPRAGIIHRLDKDTSGLMVVAKNLTAHTALVAALARRDIKREYLALVGGEMIAGKTISAPMGRHPTQRTKMAVLAHGKTATTHFRCQKRYIGFTLLELVLETGRTHQIRVHLSHEGYPIVGDSLYGWRYRVPANSSQELQTAVLRFKRQALHAWRLGLDHPVTGEPLSWTAPVPDDFAELLKLLK